MNLAKQQRLLSAQTAVARKAFEAVPIQSTCREHDVIGHLRDTGTTVGLHTVRACLLDMKDAGLIREPARGQYQRTTISDPQPAPKPVSEAPMPQATPTAAPLDLLSALAVELITIGTEFNQRLHDMAGRVEELALSLEAQRETDAAAMAKAQQLQALLKEFAK